MAFVTLILRDVAIGVVDRGEAVAVRVHHVVDVGFHGEMARAAKLNGLDSLDDENRSKAGQNHGKNAGPSD